MKDDGVLFICELTDTSENGDMPKLRLHKTSKYWFEDQSVGFSRYYQAMAVGHTIDKVVKIAFAPEATTRHYAVLGNGDQYRIEQVQFFKGNESSSRSENHDSLRYTLLTLSKEENVYDVETEENP